MCFYKKKINLKIMKGQIKKCSLICTYLNTSDFVIFDVFRNIIFTSPGTVEPIDPGPEKIFTGAACGPRATLFAGLL
jgi:hypothetical protein